MKRKTKNPNPRPGQYSELGWGAMIALSIHLGFALMIVFALAMAAAIPVVLTVGGTFNILTVPVMVAPFECGASIYYGTNGNGKSINWCLGTIRNAGE